MSEQRFNLEDVTYDSCVHRWQYEKLALQSLSVYHSSLIANFLYCVLSAAFVLNYSLKKLK